MITMPILCFFYSYPAAVASETSAQYTGSKLSGVKFIPAAAAGIPHFKVSLQYCHGTCQLSNELKMNREDEKGEFIPIRIRSTDGSEVEVKVARKGTITDLKQKITEKLQLRDRYLRLIFSGKMLAPATATIESFKIESGSFIHAVVSDKPPNQTNSHGSSSVASAPSIDMNNLRGLNRLMLADPPLRSALSIDEVASLRTFFREDLNDYRTNSVTRHDDESEVDFGYRVEEEWMEAQGPGSEFRLNLYGRSFLTRHAGLFGLNPMEMDTLGSQAFRLSFSTAGSNNNNNNNNNRNSNSNGDDSSTFTGSSGSGSGSSSGGSIDMGTFRDFIYGFIMGFALGFMMIFCVWDRNVSHKMKLGIMCGVLLHILLSIMQQEQRNPTSSNHGSSGTVPVGKISSGTMQQTGTGTGTLGTSTTSTAAAGSSDLEVTGLFEATDAASAIN